MKVNYFMVAIATMYVAASGYEGKYGNKIQAGIYITFAVSNVLMALR